MIMKVVIYPATKTIIPPKNTNSTKKSAQGILRSDIVRRRVRMGRLGSILGLCPRLIRRKLLSKVLIKTLVKEMIEMDKIIFRDKVGMVINRSNTDQGIS